MISIKEKIAYGLGDTASNIIFQTVMMFLLIFYTDVVGLSPALVGTLFLGVRLIDAVTDPLMGNFADKTRTRWGQFRPFLLWLAVPFGIISVLAFITPDFSLNGKIIYASITYILLMLAYTAINIPYSALGGVLTTDPKERVSIQSYRFVCGMFGGLIVAALTMPLVSYFGDGDAAKGYQLTMTAMSIFGVILFLLCFLGTKERVVQPPVSNSSFKSNLKILWKNDQWRVLCIAALFLLTGQVLRATLAVYYVKYYLSQEELITAFMTVGMIGSILGCSLSNQLAKRVCKIKAYIALQLIAACICIVSYWVGSADIVIAFVMFFLWSFFLQMATPLLWAKIIDTVDYGYFKTGVKNNGMVFSSVVFFIKLGVAFGGAIAGWLLAYYGYQADVVQTEETKHGLLLSFTIFPAIGSLIVAWVMRSYTLTNEKIAEMNKDATPNTI